MDPGFVLAGSGQQVTGPGRTARSRFRFQNHRRNFAKNSPSGKPGEVCGRERHVEGREQTTATADCSAWISRSSSSAEELRVENERLRRQLVQMPTFQIKSKLVSSSRAMAILEFGEKSIRIRQGIELSVPVSEGVWTLMKVLKISNDFIELEFPELERTVLLYD